ncbi:solute carrier family 35 member F1-like [Tropilaelaps mercedesae]|uniref:Solute carrier family 35 member F1-like n=1 Tax=Tropilaelaps mercedesae TaxID=418985 RepID=A0A1V9X3H0_9ACAR|nr:solute carrier family 35 member F1-like [Tropilaelaps mercedesae]
MERAGSLGDVAEQDSFVREEHPRCRYQRKERFNLCNTLKSVICGQLVSVLVCGTAYCLHDIKSVHRPRDIKDNAAGGLGLAGADTGYVGSGLAGGGGISNLSAALVFPTYVVMFLIFTPFLACRRGEDSLLNVVRGRGVKYFVVAAIDVEANYLIIHAYKYTTLPSVQMLDCFSIPIVLALSWLFLKVRYKIVHICGVGVCLLGVGSLVWSNVLEYNNTTPQNRLFGDMLCLSAGALYGVSNVLQEFTVKAFSGSVEFLAMIGLFASAISGIQMAILELDAVQTALSLPPPQQLPLIGFCFCQIFVYLFASVVIAHSSATALNLSVLSADGLSLLGYYYILNETFGVSSGLHYLYVISLSLVLTGVLLFSLSPTPLGCLVNIRLANQHLHSRLSVAVQLDPDNAAESEALRPADSCEAGLANGNHHYPNHSRPTIHHGRHHLHHQTSDIVQCARVADYDLLR